MRTIWLFIFFSVLIWSAIDPKDYVLWFLQLLPVFVGFIVLIISYKSFPLTRLLYILILVYSLIIMLGAHYSYTEVPLFDSIRPILGFGRNNYDKIGHFFQGFVPALIVREILIRKGVVTSSKWRNFFIICICLSFSALYELVEWGVAVASRLPASVSLGTQGFVWDTQADMAFALIGSVVALLFFSRIQDREMVNLSSRESA